MLTNGENSNTSDSHDSPKYLLSRAFLKITMISLVIQQTVHLRCEICKTNDKNADPIFSGCPFVRSFWDRIGWRPEGIAKVAELWKTQVPPHLHAKVAHPLILLCCWEIWRHRNDVVFRGLEVLNPALTG